LLELANAYASLARLGEWKPYSLVVPTAETMDAERKNAPVHPERGTDLRTCYLIADILSDPQARVISFGPRSVIGMPFRCAVKTGTSTNYRDNWTLGYTPEFTVGVWCGNFDNSPMSNVSGVTGAGPIFRDIMMWLHEKHGTTWYAEPAGLVRAKIDPRNGKRLDAASPTSRSNREDVFLAGTLPPSASASDYDGEGRAILPPEFSHWISQGEHWLTGLVTAKPNGSGRTALPPRILTPADGSTFVLDPELPGRGGRLLLRASSGSEVKWFSPTLTVTTENGLSYAELIPGAHELSAVDEISGAETRTRIHVRDPRENSVRLKP
jgi:penicillin-binding protein 1C